jgi:hypothetical protein
MFGRFKNNQVRSLLVSITIHLLVLGGVLFTPSGQPPRVETPPKLLIELGEGTATPSPKGKTGKSGKGLSLRFEKLNLGVKISPARPMGQISQKGETQTASEDWGHGYGRGDGFDQAGKTDLKTEGELLPFFTALRRRIDGNLTYPSDFSKQRIQGTVRVQLEVNDKGQFIGSFKRVDSENTFLKTYVLTILLHALREPLPQTLWSKKGNQLLVVDFDFNLYTKNEVPTENDFPQFKNLLTLQRWAYAEPIVEEKMNYALNRYMPPVIPIPGGFVIDFYRAYQMIERIGKPDPDQMRGQRLQDQNDQWKAVIRKSGN